LGQKHGGNRARSTVIHIGKKRKRKQNAMVKKIKKEIASPLAAYLFRGIGGSN
jgi:hypothetical protein